MLSKFLTIVFITFVSSLSALDIPRGGCPKAYKFSFDGHTYICFEDHFYLHDPECPCQHKWTAELKSVSDESSPNGVFEWYEITRSWVHPKYL